MKRHSRAAGRYMYRISDSRAAQTVSAWSQSQQPRGQSCLSLTELYASPRARNVVYLNGE